MNKIIILLMILSFVDLTATYLYVSSFHAKFPTLDYTSLEANPILRMSWKHLGLNRGMILGGIVVFSLLTFLAFTLSEKWQYFFLGTLAMMCVYHLLNFSQLSKL